MSESDVVYQWLGDAARRLRANERLDDASRLLVGMSVLAIVYQLVGAAISVPAVTAALLPLFLLAAGGIVVFFAWRLIGRDVVIVPDRAQAAALTDARAGLNNELASAWWFIAAASPDDFVRAHVARAAQTVRRLKLSHLLPLSVPRRLPVGLALLIVAALTMWLGPRIDLTGDETLASLPAALRDAGIVAVPQTAGDNDVESDETVPGTSELAWLKIEKLASELRAGPHTAAVAEAIAARDARTASRLLADMQRGQAAQPATGRAAKPETEQMSRELAKGIVERLQSMLSEGGGWSGQSAADGSGSSAERLTEDLTRELREEMDDAQQARPGEMSPEEQALNTTLQAMSRESTGGREAIRGEANPMQGLGRTSVGSGAMGRRIGVTTGGAGDGEQPHGNPDGNAQAEPVLGKKTLRLQLQMQTVTVDQPDTENSDGSEESFYAATQAQAATTQYQEVVAEQRSGVEQSTSAEQLPLAYRDAVKEYTVRQHRRERASGQ